MTKDCNVTFLYDLYCTMSHHMYNNSMNALHLHFRKTWCQYFDENNVRVAFWSALSETERQKQSVSFTYIAFWFALSETERQKSLYYGQSC